MLKRFAIFALAIIAVGCSKAGKRSTQPLKVFRPEGGLEPYAGLDLRTLSDFVVDFEALTGDKLEFDRRGALPWCVSRFNSGKAAWMFIQVYPGLNIPDVSYVQVHVFDGGWNQICKQGFPTGYRMFLNEAKVATDEHLQQDVLVVKVVSAGPFLVVDGENKGPAFEQGPFQRQYYAFLDGGLVSVRLEDDEGRLVRNSYRWRSPMRGPPVPKRTSEAWSHELRSKDPVRLLGALVWLTGKHLSSTEARLQNHNQERIEDSRTFEAVLCSPSTKDALLSRGRSENAWLREYVELALSLVRE